MDHDEFERSVREYRNGSVLKLGIGFKNVDVTYILETRSSNKQRHEEGGL
jgi:hypothetical protein